MVATVVTTISKSVASIAISKSMAVAIMSESTVVGVPRISIGFSSGISNWFRLSRPLLSAIVSIAIAVRTIATIAISESIAISIMSQATVVAVPRIGISRGISCGFRVGEDPGHEDSDKEQDLHIGCVWLSYDRGTPM